MGFFGLFKKSKPNVQSGESSNENEAWRITSCLEVVDVNCLWSNDVEVYRGNVTKAKDDYLPFKASEEIRTEIEHSVADQSKLSFYRYPEMASGEFNSVFSIDELISAYDLIVDFSRRHRINSKGGQFIFSNNDTDFYKVLREETDIRIDVQKVFLWYQRVYKERIS